MKKKGLIVLLATGLLLTGCGGSSLKAGEFDENTLMIDKNGVIISGITESFDKDYYKEEELKNFVEDGIKEYNEAKGENAVELTSFLVENKKASMVISYQSIADYAGINSTEAQLMSFGEAKELLPETMINMMDGSTVARENLEAEDAAQVLFISEECDVSVKGKVLYYSNCALESTDSVHAAGNETSIIIFK